MQDPIEALVAFLKADPPTAVLTAGRIYGGLLLRADTPGMPRAAISMRPAGGGLLGRGYETVTDVRVDVDCYGADPKQAWGVYLAAHQALKLLRRNVSAGTLLHWARPSSAGVLAVDPQTDWPIVLSSWQVLFSETEVPA